MAKTTKDVTKEILDVDFEDTTKAKMLDDDGYEEGKSKDREMIAKKDELVKDHFGKGGVIYKGKVKDYPGISKIIKRNKKTPVIVNCGSRGWKYAISENDKHQEIIKKYGQYVKLCHT